MKQSKDELILAVLNLAAKIKQESVYSIMLKNFGMPKTVEQLVYGMFLAGVELIDMDGQERVSYMTVHDYASELGSVGYVTFDDKDAGTVVSMELKVMWHLTNRRTNIGWNNFDANVKNGYLFEPNMKWNDAWPGMYNILFFVSDEVVPVGYRGISTTKFDPVESSTAENPCNRIFASNDPDHYDMGIPTDFIKHAVSRGGILDRVRVEIADNMLKVTHYQTWSAGKTSAWKEYVPKQVKVK